MKRTNAWSGRKHWPFSTRLALCCIPGLALFALFWIYPFGVTIYYSFVESAFRHSFAGFKNYAFVWNNVYYRTAMGNSARFCLAAVPAAWILAFVFALCLERTKEKGAAFLGFFLLPLAVPSSATVAIWTLLFPGEKNAFFALLSVFLWKNTGFAALLMRVGLSHVPVSTREAAAVEGAGAVRSMVQIVLPQMAGQSFFTALLLLSWSMKVFKESYALYGAYPPDGVYMVQNYINNQFTKMRYPNMTAASMGTAVIIAFLTAIWTGREKREEKGWL